jgi:hypothetical protein
MDESWGSSSGSAGSSGACTASSATMYVMGINPSRSIESALFFITHGSAVPYVAPYPPHVTTLVVNTHPGAGQVIKSFCTDAPADKLISLSVSVEVQGAWQGPFLVPTGAHGVYTLSPTLQASVAIVPGGYIVYISSTSAHA